MRSGDMQGAADADLAAIEAMLDALAGTGKPFVGTSGTLLLAMIAPGRDRHRGHRGARRPAH